MKRLITLAIFILWTTHSFGQSEKDLEFLDKASIEIKRGNCDMGSLLLKTISDSGKETANYVQLMMELYVCRNEPKYAIEYYQKFIAMKPQDSGRVKLLLTKAGVDPHKRNGGIEQRSKRLNHQFTMFNIGKGFCTGGNKATHKGYTEISFERYIPLFKKHAYLTGGLHATLFTGLNKTWYAAALGVPASDIRKIGPFGGPLVDLGLLVNVYKKADLLIAAGPTAGVLAYLDMSGREKVTNTYEPYKQNLETSSTVWGLKARLIYKKKWGAYLNYTKLLKDQVSATSYINYTSSDYKVPLNMGIITIGVSAIITHKDD